MRNKVQPVFSCPLKVRNFRVLCLSTALLLTACGNPATDDISQYIADVKVKAKKVAKNAKPLTFEFKVDTAVSRYEISGAKRDPFISWVRAPRKVLARPGNGPRPDKKRHREALESYPLDSLKLTGTFKANGEKIALIRAPDGVIHKIKKGNYIGSNYGKITNITKSSVKIRELIPNGMGGWESRMTSLSMRK